MTYETVAAARARLSAAARACNDHIIECEPCGDALYASAQQASWHNPTGAADEKRRGRCGLGALLAAEVTAAGMELEQERQLIGYVDTH